MLTKRVFTVEIEYEQKQDLELTIHEISLETEIIKYLATASKYKLIGEQFEVVVKEVEGDAERR